MRFSIIVPIYKIEKYIDECVQSVLTQAFTDYELILVDDGSPDSCPEICDRYAEEYPHILAVHKKNGGLSDARNAGMEAASGEYLLFLDGDDVLYPDALRGLNSALEENGFPELLIASMVFWYDGIEELEYDNGKYSLFCKNHNIYELCEAIAIQDRGFPWRAWQSVYKRDFLNEHQLRYDKSIVGAEDCDFFFRMVTFVSSFATTGTIIIKYREAREGSITSSPSFASVKGELVTFRHVFDFWENIGSEPVLRLISKSFIRAVLRSGKLEDKDQRIQCINFIRSHERIIFFPTKSPKFAFFKAVWKIFGYGNGTQVLLKLQRAKNRIIKKPRRR